MTTDRVTAAGRVLRRELRAAERVMDVDEALDAYDNARDLISSIVEGYARDLATAEATGRAPIEFPWVDLDAAVSGMYLAGVVAASREVGVITGERRLASWPRSRVATLAKAARRVLNAVQALRGFSTPGDVQSAVSAAGAAQRAVLAEAAGTLRASAILAGRAAQDEVRRQLALGLPPGEAIDRAVKASRPASAAADVLSPPYGAGLADVFERHVDRFGGYEYSAILDGGTCDECAPLDGTFYRTLQDLYTVLPGFGPNPKCRGRKRCRCRGVPVPPDDPRAKVP